MSIPFREVVLGVPPVGGGAEVNVSDPISGEALQSSSRMGNGYVTVQVLDDGLPGNATYTVVIQGSAGSAGGEGAEWYRIGEIKHDSVNKGVSFPTSRGVWYRVELGETGGLDSKGVRVLIVG